ncbi:MAG: DUF4271 domain-containing protein [Bacteroidales bacterium]|jgi:hypothetical protein|nr:DUF4271 domain-containing protein [Bacteroidales bacterium]NPV37367.1 DUF4271 domain-containing protein [Bacteroidales bacterium]
MPDTLNTYVFQDTSATIAPVDALKSLAEQMGFNYTSAASGNTSIDTLPAYSGPFFRGHLLQVKYPLKEIPLPSPIDTSYILIVASILMVVLIKNLGNKALLTYFSKVSASEKRDKYAFNKTIDWLHSLNALFAYTTLIYFLTKGAFFNMYPKLSEIRLIFLLLMPGLILYLQFKKSLIDFLGNVFRIRLFSQSLIFEENRFMRMSGLVILPFLMVSIMGSGKVSAISLLISCTIVIIFYLRKIFMWTLASFKNINIVGIYFFLYLCTVEILPLILLAKLLINN